MLAKISYSIVYVAALFSIVPFLLGLIKWRQHDAVQRPLFVIVTLSMIADAVSHIGRKIEYFQPIVFYTFTLIEFGILLYIFRIYLVQFLPLRWFRIVVVLFIGFAAADMIWLSGFDQFNTYSTAVESLILIALCLIFFYKILKELSIEHLEQAPIFWISTATLLYFSSSLFIFLFTNNVKSSYDTLYILWGVHGIFTILRNIFYSIALWLKAES